MFTKKGDAAVLAKLDEAPAQHREIARRLHQIVRQPAPDLEPIVRWVLPYYTRDGKDVCYIKGKDFLAFGFAEVANPARADGADMHPVAWTVTGLNDATEATIRELIKKATRN